MIELSECHREDIGMYCFAGPKAISQNLGAAIIYVDERQFRILMEDNAECFKKFTKMDARPLSNGLYYLPNYYLNFNESELRS